MRSRITDHGRHQHRSALLRSLALSPPTNVILIYDPSLCNKRHILWMTCTIMLGVTRPNPPRTLPKPFSEPDKHGPPLKLLRGLKMTRRTWLRLPGLLGPEYHGTNPRTILMCLAGRSLNLIWPGEQALSEDACGVAESIAYLRVCIVASPVWSYGNVNELEAHQKSI